MFVTEEDYRVVIGETALKVISQVSEENRTSAEAEAREEIAGYLRPKYDCEAVFNAEGDDRNRLIVMYTCDIALYHMSASMPQKMGSEIREVRLYLICQRYKFESESQRRLCHCAPDGSCI